MNLFKNQKGFNDVITISIIGGIIGAIFIGGVFILQEIRNQEKIITVINYLKNKPQPSIIDNKEKKDLPVTLANLRKLSQGEKITYTKSLDKWDELKEKYGNSYIYQTNLASFVGTSKVTEVIIKDNIAVARKFQAREPRPNFTQQVVASFSEDVSNLNSNTAGDSAISIDELYQSCPKYLDVDEEKNTIYFITDENGLMMTCGYVPNNCYDDCFSGIRISSFEWL